MWEGESERGGGLSNSGVKLSYVQELYQNE